MSSSNSSVNVAMPRSHPLLAPRIASSSYHKNFFIPSPAEIPSSTFHPKATIGEAMNVTVQAASVGLFVSVVQNALADHNHGAMGVFTRTGGTIGYFAAMGFSYSAISSMTANIRAKDDPFNAAAGGCAAGFIMGLRARSLPTAFGACAFTGTVLATFEATGDQLQGINVQGMTREEKQAFRDSFINRNPTYQPDPYENYPAPRTPAPSQ